jgi:hypothetical protein
MEKRMQASAAMESPLANDLCRRSCLLGCRYQAIYETKPLSFHEAAAGTPVMPDIAQIIFAVATTVFRPREPL